MHFFMLQQEQFVLKIWVQSGAKKMEVMGVYGGFLKVRVNAAPIEGKANAALIRWLSKIFNVPLRSINIKQGLQSNKKTVLIGYPSMDVDTLLLKLNIK